MTRRDSVESRRLDVPDAKLLGVSSSGELAFLRGRHGALRLLNAQEGTLLRVSITGGGPRELLDDVIAADWTPGGSDLAVVRRGQVEFPLGTKIYGRNAFRHVRVAPDGQRLALAEGEGGYRNIVLLDRSGRKTTLSSGWGDLTSLAWSPSGDEVWFTANRREDLTTSALRAVSTDGRERVLFPSAAISCRSTMSFLTAVFCSRRMSLGWDARACRRVKRSREISGGSIVQRQRHFRRTDERCSWAKWARAEVPQAQSISEGLTVRMPFALATAFQKICHLMASGCWLRR